MLSKMFGIGRIGWIKLALIILLITIVRTMVQPLIPESGPGPFPPSVFVDKGLMPVAFVIYGIVMLGLLALVFLLIQARLPGTRLAKGLTFGLSFGLLWFVYLCEPLPHGSWTFPDFLYYPIIDGTTVASLGVLMGLFVVTDSKKGTGHTRPGTGTFAMIAIPVAFLLGRVMAYDVLHIYTAFDIRPFDTLLWGTAMGLWTMVMYLALRPGIEIKSPWARAVFFGFVIFGVNIFLNDMFMPIPFRMEFWGLGTFSFVDMAVRTLTDVVSVSAGIFLYEKIRLVMDPGSSGIRSRA